MWRSSAETWVNENKSITALCYSSVCSRSFLGTLQLVPLSASARQQRLICALVGQTQWPSAGEYHPQVFWASLCIILSYLCLISLLDITLDVLYSGTLINRYLKPLKWGLVHSWQFFFPENNFISLAANLFEQAWDTQRDWRKTLCLL